MAFSLVTHHCPATTTATVPGITVVPASSALCGYPHKAERGVRPLKTQQKISGRLTSDDVTQDRLDIRGYIDTARKHGPGAHDVLHQSCSVIPGCPQPSRYPRNKEIRSVAPLPAVHQGECLLDAVDG
jgi:hypothetical protein